tara:strand:- start:256 stop:642 length:387 start_codon:yes stop_codon:yes gene_type:complete
MPVGSAWCEAAFSVAGDDSQELITEDRKMATVTVDAWSTAGHLLGGRQGERRTLSVDIDDSATLAKLLERLADEYSRFEEVMYKPGTRVPSEYLAIVVNDRLPELLDGYETRLNDGDTILIVQAYQGG